MGVKQFKSFSFASAVFGEKHLAVVGRRRRNIREVVYWPGVPNGAKEELNNYYSR